MSSSNNAPAPPAADGGYAHRFKVGAALGLIIHDVLTQGCFYRTWKDGTVERVPVRLSGKLAATALRYLAWRERQDRPEWLATNVLGKAGQAVLALVDGRASVVEVDGQWIGVVSDAAGEVVAEATHRTRAGCVDLLLSRVLRRHQRRAQRDAARLQAALARTRRTGSGGKARQHTSGTGRKGRA